MSCPLLPNWVLAAGGLISFIPAYFAATDMASRISNSETNPFSVNGFLPSLSAAGGIALGGIATTMQYVTHMLQNVSTLLLLAAEVSNIQTTSEEDSSDDIRKLTVEDIMRLAQSAQDDEDDDVSETSDEDCLLNLVGEENRKKDE
jgi:hypothetical protein